MTSVVTFKSIPLNYNKEFIGIKPNTLRKIDETDIRFKALRDGCSRIRIVNTETHEYFEREIIDYTEWDGYAIISWIQNDA